MLLRSGYFCRSKIHKKMHILMWVDGPLRAIYMEKRDDQMWPVLHYAACQCTCAAASLLTQNQTVAPTSGNLASTMIHTPVHLKAHRTLSLQQKLNSSNIHRVYFHQLRNSTYHKFLLLLLRLKIVCMIIFFI